MKVTLFRLNMDVVVGELCKNAIHMSSMFFKAGGVDQDVVKIIGSVPKRWDAE